MQHAELVYSNLLLPPRNFFPPLKISYGFGDGGGGDDGDDGDDIGFGHTDGEPDLTDLYEVDADGELHTSIANDSMGEWYGAVKVSSKAMVEKYGDIMPRRYRMQSTSARVEGERSAFDAKLELLVDRCNRGHQSETTLEDLKLDRVSFCNNSSPKYPIELR